MKDYQKTLAANNKMLNALRKLKWIKISLLAMIFIATLVAVFLLSSRMSAKTYMGFPTFQDSAFELVDHDGVKRDPSDFLGKPIALFFGFTYCPDTCPTTLITLTAAQDQLTAEGQKSEDLQIIFVSVDPTRDTPSQLKSYLNLFDANVTGLTGSINDIKAILKHFGIYARRIGDGDDYLYDHSAVVYLYRADGSFKGTIVHSEPMEYIVQKIRSILLSPPIVSSSALKNMLYKNSA
jgi:protein SCO1/2